MINQFSLFKYQRFLPIFVVQFLGAFNDNVFKNALIVLTTFTLVYKVTPTVNATLGASFTNEELLHYLVVEI